jgi:hypothetical protein
MDHSTQRTTERDGTTQNSASCAQLEAFGSCGWMRSHRIPVLQS